MEEKLAEVLEEIKLVLEEVAAKTLKKACYNTSCVSYSIYTSPELSRSSAACADVVALFEIIIQATLWVLFSCVLFLMALILVGHLTQQKLNPSKFNP